MGPAFCFGQKYVAAAEENARLSGMTLPGPALFFAAFCCYNGRPPSFPRTLPSPPATKVQYRKSVAFVQGAAEDKRGRDWVSVTIISILG